jgi:hypothetical protein
MNDEHIILTIKNVSSNVVALDFKKSLDSEEYCTMFLGPNSVRTIEKDRLIGDKIEELRERGIIRTDQYQSK